MVVGSYSRAFVMSYEVLPQCLMVELREMLADMLLQSMAIDGMLLSCGCEGKMCSG